jgi:hypothetical protein
MAREATVYRLAARIRNAVAIAWMHVARWRFGLRTILLELVRSLPLEFPSND